MLGYELSSVEKEKWTELIGSRFESKLVGRLQTGQTKYIL